MAIRRSLMSRPGSWSAFDSRANVSFPTSPSSVSNAWGQPARNARNHPCSASAAGPLGACVNVAASAARRRSADGAGPAERGVPASGTPASMSSFATPVIWFSLTW